MAHAIQVERLTKQFGPVRAVDDLSFTVDEGRVTGFLGPNGAGKTTTLRMLLGLVNPTAGEATVMGQPFTRLPDPVHTVGAVLDGGMLHPGRSGRNHLRTLAKAAGIGNARVEQLLELVALSDAAHRRAGGYSLGMRQRLGLAAALLGDPPVLVLDEPANGLDPQGIRWLRTFLRQLAGEGRTVLVSSHVLPEVEQTADDVLVLAGGRLVRQGTLAELGGGAQTSTVVRSPDAARLVELLTAVGLPGTWVTSDELRVEAPPERVGELAAEHGVVLHRLTGSESGLEDVFLRLTGQGRA